ncbi:hypothetical protein [Cohnella sp. GCM10027633]|uniref:hypothetical protein n=1 Tax=unclassified Cohnella TaxID=2636738 RepID=UPI003631944D
MNEWSATIWASLSAMAAAIVISLIVLLGSMARESASVLHEQDTAVAILKEHRKYSPYDDASGLYAQDLVSVIAETGGYPAIRVYTGLPAPDQVWSWERQAGAGITPDPFSVSTLTEKFDVFPDSARFSSALVREANGGIGTIEFRRQP